MTNNFKPEEFECNCGCGLNNMHPNTLFMLEQARDETGVPIVINSGCRCLTYNRKIGSKDTSSHLKGLAIDIKCMTSRIRSKIISALIKAGFNRIGIGKTFVHADSDELKDQNVIWLY